MSIFSSIYNFIFRRSRKKKSKNGSPRTGETERPFTPEELDQQLKDSISVPADEHIYTALEKRGLLVRPRFPKSLGMHLIAEGQVGLSVNNGRPRFLASGGRHTLWSPFNKYMGKMKIDEVNQETIVAGAVTILTVPQGKIAWTVKNGRNIILDAGRYILEAPHHFVESASLDTDNIKLGTHHRIRIPAGHIGIAYDNYLQCIIEAPKSKKDRVCIVDSETFKFGEIKSVQVQEIKLDSLNVKTREMIGLEVVGLIRFKVIDPKLAYLQHQNVENMLKLQSESVLNSIFAKIPLEELSTGVSSTNEKDADMSKLTTDLIHRVTRDFVEECRSVVEKWGIELQNLNILTIKFEKDFIKTIQDRVQRKIIAKTELDVMANNNAAAMAQTHRERMQTNVRAKAAAEARITDAKAKAEAAEILSENPIAERLAMTAAMGEALTTIGPRMILTDGVTHNRLKGLFYTNAIDSGQTLFNNNANSIKAKKAQPVALRRLSTPT